MLMTHDFKKPTLNFARDIFVFAAFTGLAFIDMKELKSSSPHGVPAFVSGLTAFEKSLHLINNI